MDLSLLEDYIEKIKSTPATLLWEYGFEFSEKDFENFNALINSNQILPEEEELLTTLYLYYIGVEKYKEGNFWKYTKYIENNPQAQKKAYENFKNFIKKYNLFSYKIKKSSYKYVSHILIHAVLPKFYANEFLKIVYKIYERFDDLDYLYFITENELKKFYFLKIV